MWVKGGGHIVQDTMEQIHPIPHHPAPPRDGKAREEAKGEEDIFKTMNNVIPKHNLPLMIF